MKQFTAVKYTALLALLLCCGVAWADAHQGDYYEIRIYHVGEKAQETAVEEFLKDVYLPALHRAGIAKVGVFKPVKTDTIYFGKRIYVLIPFKSLDEFSGLEGKLLKDPVYAAASSLYLSAPYDHAPYGRIESILAKAFPDAPSYQTPQLSGPQDERVYELRSYEGPTERIFASKVKMFNEGGEIVMFKRLGFNAVFYSEVIAGRSRPNLMYMTSFNNMASRDEHWKTFVADSEWKRISTMPEYMHNISKLEIFLLNPCPYSDL